MKLEHETVQNIEQHLLKIFSRHLGDLTGVKLFFFGSRVKGDSQPGSDIDVGIDVGKPLHLEILGRIDDDLEELPFLYKIQVVDFHSVDAQFRSVALQHIQPFISPYGKVSGPAS